MLALSISLSREYTGPAQVGRQVWSVRYYVEILGLWDPQNRDPRRKSQKSERATADKIPGLTRPQTRLCLRLDSRTYVLYWSLKLRAASGRANCLKPYRTRRGPAPYITQYTTTLCDKVDQAVA